MMGRPPRHVAYAARVLTAVVCLLGATASFAYDPKIEPYVRFLDRPHATAKDYVLGLFDDHDIVILCERDHRDITQYDLFLGIIRDERFIDRVGNVFTEIGVSTLNPALNDFMQREGLAPDSVTRYIHEFHRNCSWDPIWEKQNFSYLLRGVYEINQDLPAAKKVRLYPSDMPFTWQGADSARLADLQHSLDGRDSVMAYQIVEVFERLDRASSAGAKALVIMNFRHAFNRHMEKPSGDVRHNVGGYLVAKYGDRVANVYVNFAVFNAGSTDSRALLSAIQDGRWDAAFKWLGIEDAGFDLANSPFGADDFDIWPYRNPSLYWDDVFTGLVYYLPPEKFRCVVGIAGIVDSAFLPELLRRRSLDRRVSGLDPDAPVDTGALIQLYSTVKELREDDLDSITARIESWLR